MAWLFDMLGALTLLYPKRCVLCEQPCKEGSPVQPFQDVAHICAACLALLPHNNKACNTCALPLQLEESVQCGQCLGKQPIWASAHALWRYESQAQWLIQHYKYAKAYYLDRSFSALLAAYADRLLQDQFDAVVPVPMHKRRWVSRGFNQAEVLARAVAKQLDLPLLAREVERVKNTPRFAAGQDKKARRRAIKGAFRVNADMPDRLLIVDDVKTTGATSEELARVLLQAGAKSVSVLVLARTV